MFNAKKFVSAIISAALCCSLITAIPASAKDYTNSSCKFLAKVTNNGEYVSMQGMAGDSSYIYVAKKKDSKAGGAQIYRIDMRTKAVEQMSFTSAKVSDQLKHANDMFFLYENGTRYLYVNTSHATIIKLKIDDNKKQLKKVKTITVYDPQKSGEKLTFSGLAGYETDYYNQNKYKIILKKGKDIYTATINKNNTNENITPTFKFSLQTNVIMNWNGYNYEYKLSDTNKNTGWYANQGITYANGKLYTAISRNSNMKDIDHNESFIVVYDNITNKLNSNSRSSTAPYYDGAKFHIISNEKNYPYLYEIESCAVINNVLYFNTNRAKSSTNTDYDAVLYMKNYKA